MSFPLPRCKAPVFGILLFLQSCEKPPEQTFTATPQVEIDLEAIRSRGYLNALVDNNSVSYFIFRGEPVGFEYELLQQFAEDIGVELRIKIISGVEESIDLLNKGEGDVIAFPLTITEERSKYINFSKPLFSTTQVLVQKKVASDSTSNKLIRLHADLIGKQVHVMKGSSFKDRLQRLSEEIGGQIVIVEDSAGAETESLIRQVAIGEIPFTVTDQTFAMVNASVYPDLDINTVISLPQEIGWSTRANSPELNAAVNSWLEKVKRSGMFRIIYDKYFNSPRTTAIRMSSDYSSLSGGKLSIFDETIRKEAEALGWDWRLVASIVYQESGFNPNVRSWAGAVGLMQLMPAASKQFKVVNAYDPVQNIQAGIRVLHYLDGLWAKTVSDPDERLKFVLASYNVGMSHVIDARNLASKYGKDPTRWDDNVETYLLLKTKPQYYRDPVASAGYCRCYGPVNYVKEVLGRFEAYKAHIN
ncbi:MAG TPA: transporter substrate-binding domain-containing protein [Cyclobacteriaceae bacterium]|nr:transporter substrate-binding domain-containing protein [Cyclobacteriaceae bacterium]